jgi:ABC-2 type transport system permease protein
VLAGVAFDGPLLAWLGVPAGVLTGLLAFVSLGRAAYRSLARRGPELLYLMRAGEEARAQAGEGASVLDAMPRSRRRLLLGSVIVGCIALFPQALVPALMKASGEIARVWFLALHVPGPWQWPTTAFMVLLGADALVLAWRIYAAEARRRA